LLVSRFVPSFLQKLLSFILYPKSKTANDYNQAALIQQKNKLVKSYELKMSRVSRAAQSSFSFAQRGRNYGNSFT